MQLQTSTALLLKYHNQLLHFAKIEIMLLFSALTSCTCNKTIPSTSVITKKFSVHNKWMMANHHSQLLDGLDFRVCCRASAQTRTAACWKTNVFRKLQESVLFEMTDEALHVKLVNGIKNLSDPAFLL